jgi:hypothetical protein
MSVAKGDGMGLIVILSHLKNGSTRRTRWRAIAPFLTIPWGSETGI